MASRNQLTRLKILALRTLFKTEKDTDKNNQTYWNTRWSLNIPQDYILPGRRLEVLNLVQKALDEHGCNNVLEVGCGADVPLRDLECAFHLDYSMAALKRSKLDSFIFADLTKGIPVPDKSFDATFSCCVLMHLPDDMLSLACAEIVRVTKKLVIILEGKNDTRDMPRFFDGVHCEVLRLEDKKRRCPHCGSDEYLLLTNYSWWWGGMMFHCTFCGHEEKVRI